MKILFLAPHWLGNFLMHRSLAALGHEIVAIDYSRPRRLPVIVSGVFDLTVLVPATDAPPQDEELRDLKGRTPLVLLCPEASEPNFHEIARHLTEAELVDLIVTCDGMRAGWPYAERHLAQIFPIDPALWGTPRGWGERSWRCGFRGSLDKDRQHALRLMDDTVTIFPTDGPYEEFVSFMRDCRAGVNFCAYGGGQKGAHVKARIAEIALADALLLEPENSPAEEWFEKGKDYLAWRTPEHCAEIIRDLDKNEHAEAIAASLRRKVLERHSPALFWDTVFKRVLK